MPAPCLPRALSSSVAHDWGEPVTPVKALEKGHVINDALLWACCQRVGLSREGHISRAPPAAPSRRGPVLSPRPQARKACSAFPWVLCPEKAGTAFPECHPVAPLCPQEGTRPPQPSGSQPDGSGPYCCRRTHHPVHHSRLARVTPGPPALSICSSHGSLARA